MMETNAPALPHKTSPFRVIGYLTDHADPDAIPFEKLTHVNYAFLLPNEDGTFRAFNNPSKLEQMVKRAHERGINALVSVGGWGWESQFEKMAARPERRAVFTQQLLKVIQTYQLDGADIDWEYPKPGQSAQNFLALMQELRAALPKQKLLSAAVVAFGEIGGGIPTDSFASMDFVNIMAYDDHAHPSSHSSMECARASLDYWIGRGLSTEKAVLGVPFYSRPDGIPYFKLIETDRAAASTDFFDYDGIKVNYNGMTTIQAKARLALERASGIMFWALGQDTNDDTSLLATIDHVIKGKV